MTARQVGERWVEAIARHDEVALREVLAPEVDFRALTPGRFWEGTEPDAVVDTVLGHWFEESDKIDAVSLLEFGDDVGAVSRVGYRFDITNDDGLRCVEQQAYFRVDGERLSYLRVVCSGYQPREA